MKNILILSDWYKPGFKAGGPIRSVSNLVDALKEHFQFHIITRNTDYLEHTPYPKLPFNTPHSLQQHEQATYLSSPNNVKHTLRRMLQDINPRVVYLNSLYSYYFTLLPLFLLRKQTNIKIILAPRGMLSQGSLAVKSLKKKGFLLWAKNSSLFRPVCFHATSEQEYQDIRHFFPHNRVFLCPNFPQMPAENFVPPPAAKPLRLLSIARIAPEKNILTALQLLQNCTCPLHYTIAGPVYNQAYAAQCRNMADSLPAHIQVTFADTLSPNEVEQALGQSHLFYLPSTGENFGHAIFEALSAGRPVLISDTTPWKHNEENGIFAFPLSKPEKFTETLIRLAALNTDEYAVLSAKSLNFARNYYNQAVQTDLIIQELNNVSAGH